MPGINVSPAMVTEFKEAIISTGEKILRVSSADYQAFGELSSDPQYIVKGIL